MVCEIIIIDYSQLTAIDQIRIIVKVFHPWL